MDMENFRIAATKYTPEIKLDAKNGLIEVSGKSYPENSFEFYQPFMRWIQNYLKSPAPFTTVNMEIIYFNSSSSKLFFDFFDLLEESKDATSLTINWIYDPQNESALEAGEDFMEEFPSLHFHLVEKS